MATGCFVSSGRSPARALDEAGTTSPCVGPISGSDFDATLHAAAP
jgi:hypothetical protein